MLKAEIQVERLRLAFVRNFDLRSWLIRIVLSLVSGLTASSASAQINPQSTTGTHGTRSVQAARTDPPLVLDGSLDEPAWQQARISQEFVQKDPQEGELSTERTEFRIVYTATTLYIGVICYDSTVGGIVAAERRRDNELENDDRLSIVLDTFHDHRNAFLFRTNPLGTQYDALITDEGNSVNANWDEKWDVVSRITPEGWTAEFAIPFKSLRVSEQNGRGWGLDLERVIRRKNESSYWNGYRRGFQLANVSQAGHLDGLENIESGLRLRVKPFAVAGFRQASDGSRSTFRNASDIGIEVMKYRITPSLTADVTVNTDFAQTEVDDQQVNLDRFPLFFPEKREFFQEGAGVYEIGRLQSVPFRTGLRLFHSRTIGLSPKRRIVPITAGGRVTGKLRGFTLGMLNVQTEELAEAFDDQTGERVEERIPASNYSVLRVKRDVLARSSIGGFLLNREIAGSRDFNRVYGVDANFVFFRHFSIGGLLGKSSSPGIERDNWVSSGAVGCNSDFLVWGTSWTVVDPEFRNDMGFVPRQNFRQLSPTLSFQPRPNSRLVRQLNFAFRANYSMNQKNVLETKQNAYEFEIHFQDGGVFGWVPHTYFDRPPEKGFRIRPGIVIPEGPTGWWSNVLRYRSNRAKRFSGEFRWEQNYGYYGGGSLNELRFEGRLRVNEQFSVEPLYELNKASLHAGNYTDDQGNVPQRNGAFTDHVLNTRINYNFNNQWLTSTILQYNNADSFWGFNFRLNYIFRPGDDLFLVYNEGRRALFDLDGHPITGVFDGRKDRSLQLKLTYSFDY